MLLCSSSRSERGSVKAGKRVLAQFYTFISADRRSLRGQKPNPAVIKLSNTLSAITEQQHTSIEGQVPVKKRGGGVRRVDTRRVIKVTPSSPGRDVKRGRKRPVLATDMSDSDSTISIIEMSD